MACRCGEIDLLKSKSGRCATAITYLNSAQSYGNQIKEDCSSLSKYANTSVVTSDDEGLINAILKLPTDAISCISAAINAVSIKKQSIDNQIVDLQAEDDAFDHSTLNTNVNSNGSN